MIRSNVFFPKHPTTKNEGITICVEWLTDVNFYIKFNSSSTDYDDVCPLASHSMQSSRNILIFNRNQLSPSLETQGHDPNLDHEGLLMGCKLTK
jgi:hypothetical protein